MTARCGARLSELREWIRLLEKRIFASSSSALARRLGKPIQTYFGVCDARWLP